jgi:hypothetical protein
MPYRACFGVTYAHLFQVFGPPTTNGDGDKSDAEWVIRTPKGWALIRNWKDGKNYGSTYALDAKDIVFWNLKGWMPDIVPWLEDALQSHAHQVVFEFSD